MIERLIEAVVLRRQAAAADAARDLRVVKYRGKIQTARLPMIDRGAHFDFVHAPDHFIHRPEADPRHPLANFFGDVEEEVDDVLRRALELLAQNWILRRDADRTRIQVAFAHHDAAHGDQRRSGESEFFGAEQRGDGNVAAGLQLAVRLYAYA